MITTKGSRWLEAHEQVAAMGINCTAPRHTPSLIKEIRKNTTKPIVVYPNSGEAYDPHTKTWNGCSSPGDFTAHAHQWFEAGARLIGGCCRTTPEDIRAIARLRSGIEAGSGTV